MATKAQLAADIRHNIALKSYPAADSRRIEREAKALRKLINMPKPQLEALHAKTLTISADAAALAELVAETLEGRGVIISISAGTVRVEQPIAEMCRERVAGFDETVRALTAAGFHSFSTSGCTCFLDAI